MIAVDCDIMAVSITSHICVCRLWQHDTQIHHMLIWHIDKTMTDWLKKCILTDIIICYRLIVQKRADVSCSVESCYIYVNNGEVDWYRWYNVMVYVEFMEMNAMIRDIYISSIYVSDVIHMFIACIYMYINIYTYCVYI